MRTVHLWPTTLILTAVVLAGCSEGDDPDAAPEPSGPRALEIADRFVHAGEPDFLLDAFGSVWAQTASGYLLRLDPATGELLDTFDTGYHSVPGCNGNGVTETEIWVCAGPDRVARVDPETGVASPMPFTKRADQTVFPYAAGLVWFIQSGTTDLVGLDGAGAVGGTVPLGMVCTDTIPDGDSIWVLCPTVGKVLEVDAPSATVVNTLEVANPRAGAVAEDLFVSSAGDLLQVDTDSLEVLHTYGDVDPFDVAASESEVWLRTEGERFLTALDPAAHEVTATVEAPDIPGGGDVMITDDWIWATSYDDNVVVRVAR